jgi:hypothetical protein
MPTEGLLGPKVGEQTPEDQESRVDLDVPEDVCLRVVIVLLLQQEDVRTDKACVDKVEPALTDVSELASNQDDQLDDTEPH